MAATVPAGVETVLAFLNTVDVETASDELSEPSHLAAFLSDHALLPRGAPVTARDLERARALRAALRQALVAHHGGELAAGTSGDLDRVASELPLRVALDGDGEPTLEPVSDGARGALARLLAIVAVARATDDWVRLKICPEDTCQWAFYDQSRNRSRRWCSMDVCGNRTKTRTYRARHARV
jgi:predicted RNA-binding Zn ribbon-like protein